MAEKERVDIGRKACLGAGVNVISSFDEGSTESIFLKEWYELVVESELSLHPWRFATKTVDLGSPLADEPTSRFNVAHQKPNDCIHIDTILEDDTPIEFDIMEDQIHSNDTSTATLIAEYRYRADESKWSPYFKMLIVYRLATMMSFSIARKDDVAASMKTLADEHWKRAKTKDSQGKSAKRLRQGRLKRVRSGGRIEKFWRNR